MPELFRRLLMHVKGRRRGDPMMLLVFCCKGQIMLDIVLLALGLGFFVLSVAYAYACDRL